MVLEMQHRAGFCAIDIRGEFNGIRIHLKDAGFGPEKFDEHRVVCLDSFSNEAMPRRKEEIFRDLLRDGTRSAHGAVRMPGMGTEGIVDFQRIESMMEEESLVLAGDHGGIKVR